MSQRALCGKDVYKYKVSVIVILYACLTPVCFKHTDKG